MIFAVKIVHGASAATAFTPRSIFTSRRSYASAVLGVVILSVRPSDCPSDTRVLCD